MSERKNMARKAVSAALSALLVFSGFPTAAIAEVLPENWLATAADSTATVVQKPGENLTDEVGAASYLSDSDDTYKWNQFGTCRWRIDSNGLLTISTLPGEQTGQLGEVSSCDDGWSIDTTYSAPWVDEADFIKAVKVEPGVKAGECASLFCECTKLEIADLSGLDFSMTKSLSCLFAKCYALRSVSFNETTLTSISNVNGLFSESDFSYMFRGCSSLEKITWNGRTSAATNFGHLFEGCSSLKNIDASVFDTHGVTDFGSLFRGCTPLESLDISQFDTSNVTNMAYMFWHCGSLLQLDLSSFDTSKVTNCSLMFNGCDRLETLDLSSFDTSKITDMSYMFGESTSLRSLRLGEQFSLSGIRVKPQCSLPVYKLGGGTVLWKNSRGDVFKPDAIPANVADTYSAVINLADGWYASIESQDSSYVYTGSSVKPVLRTTLVEGVDYRLECSNNVNAGTASVDLVGIGTYTGTLHFEYEISKANPGVKAPSEVTANAGDYLRDISLPDGWVWDDPDSLLDLSDGWRYGMTATYTPSDLSNYNTVTVMIPIHVLSRGKWIQDATGWWWLEADGSYPKSEWKAIAGSWYYFDASGYMVTGWLARGFWYWLGASGAMATGWARVGGSWYWFDASGAMATGWVNSAGTWYWMDASGSMATGWRSVGGTWYWFDGSGAMATGWRQVGGAWYYFDASGAMAANRWVGNYYLTGSGAMATSQWVGPWWVGTDGCWRG